MDIVTFRTGYTYRITLDDVHEEVGPEYDVWITDDEEVVRGITEAPFSKKCFGSIYFRRKDKEPINKEEAMRLHDAIIP